MTKLLQKHGNGSLAWAMSALGPQIMLAPPDDNSDGGDDDSGADDDGDGDKGGDDDAGDKGDKKSSLREKGLFKKGENDDDNSDADADNDDDNDGDDDDDAADSDRPSDIPAKFWDAEKKEIKTDALSKAFTDLEKAHSKLRRSKGLDEDVPETADKYFEKGLEIELPDEKTGEVPPDDPALKDWATVCLSEGIGGDKATRIAKGYMKLLMQHADGPIDRDAEIASLGKNGGNIVDSVLTFFEGKENEGELSGDDVDLIGEWGKTAKGMRLLAKIRGWTGEAPIPVVSVDGSTMSASDWYDKFDVAMDKNDFGEQERLQALADKTWPDGMPTRKVKETMSLAEQRRA